ncbi:related to PDC1-Pyruvate decarboxylase, isozyme 1 [Rhynchosporium graminicola]|uniref:Pyruvate decarboxylase n=1 Tax=Rhynchosporium graminicola TaxID=2792576 RepID=A0A1E1KSX2_9HELO|nr:related to PDC1-Pyruvate decarboxylase, isozyme 1 [Rhynchosporium commune]
MASSTVPMGVYLWKRLASLGIEHVFGVPGDFNLTLLDQIYNVPELTWLGTCNELNGAYAADGYTRIKESPAALLTTYGVGELSAMNGVAGAYAEQAGMIHLVGMTSRPIQKMRALIHHTMEPGMDHAIYIGMSESVRKTHTFLMDDSTMAEEIDRVIIEGVKSRLPVFIYIPTDIVSVQLDAKRLETPLDISIQNDKTGEDAVVNSVLELIKSASNPVILADVLTIRHGGRGLARELVDLTQFQSFSTPLSKGIIDEDHPSYGGLYNGTVSFPGVAEAIHGSDLVLNLGPLLSDSNTGAFTREVKDENAVLLGHAFCQIKGKKYDGVHFLPVLRRIVEALKGDTKGYQLPRPSKGARLEAPILNKSTSGAIEQSYTWQRLGKFIRANDIVLAESGTAQFGMPDATFPANIRYITQIFWSSIGYTVGACLGALVAAKEMKLPGRVVLIVGEGSMQMTVQEIGSYIRFGFKPIIFVINNNGYSIERAINGPKQDYNNVSMLWDHQKMLEFFGAREETGIKSRSYKCKTVEELEKVLTDDDFAKADCIQVCEIVMDQFDYPWRLTKQVEISKARAVAMTSKK